jgi:hypothetical protein
MPALLSSLMPALLSSLMLSSILSSHDNETRLIHLDLQDFSVLPGPIRPSCHTAT